MLFSIQILRFEGLAGLLKMGLAGCPETSVANYQPTCITSQKNEDLYYTAVEAYNLSSISAFACQP
jgi:hypothetical protein